MLARRLDAAFFTTMPVSAERRRELRRAKAPAFPRPKGRAPDGCTWNKQAGGWFKDDGSVGVSRSEKRKLAAAIKEEAAASERENHSVCARRSELPLRSSSAASRRACASTARLSTARPPAAQRPVRDRGQGRVGASGGTVVYDCLPKLQSISKLYCRSCMFLVPGVKGMVTRVHPRRLR